MQQELLKKISSMSKTPLTCRLKQIKERLEKYGYLTSDEGPKDNIEIKDFWKNGITLMLQPKHNSAAAKTQFQIEWLENSKRILGSLSGLWLKKGIVTRAIEKLILSIQEGRAATKFFCKMIGTAKDNRCRHCKVAPETTDYILGGRAGFLRHLYKTRHDSLVQSIVNKLISWFKLGKKATRLDELLRSKIKNEKVGIKVDRRVNFNKASLYNFPGVVVVDHEQKKVSIIEVVYARPSSNNSRITEKVVKYKPVASNYRSLYRDFKVYVVPIVLGMHGMVTNKVFVFMRRLMEFTLSISEERRIKGEIAHLVLRKQYIPLNSASKIMLALSGK